MYTVHPLESLQLHVGKGNKQTLNSITNTSKDVSEELANNPKGGDESTNNVNDGNYIEAFDVIDLGDNSDSNVTVL